MKDDPSYPNSEYSIGRRRLLQAGLATGAGLFAAAGARPVAADDGDEGFIDSQPIDARPLDGEDPDWTLYRTGTETAAGTDIRPQASLYDDRVGKTFISYLGYGEDAPAFVQEFNHANDKWTPPVKVGESFDDYHNYPQMAQDHDGRLHVFHGCHNSPLRHATPEANHTVRSEWTDEAIEEAGGATYPMPFVAENGDIYCFYRETYVLGEDPGDPDYDTAYRPMRYVRSTDGGETWSNSVELTGHEGAVNDGRRDNWINEIYGEQIHHESAGNGNPERVHYTWMIAGGLNDDGHPQHNVYHHNVYYAYFTPEDLHWHTADGTDLGQSITPEEMDTQCIVENTLDDDDFSLVRSVPYDKWVNVTADGRPVVLYVVRLPDDMPPGGEVGKIAAWTGSDWQKSQLVDLTYPGYGVERIDDETFRYYAGSGYAIDVYEVDASEAGADGQIGEKVDEIPFPDEVRPNGAIVDDYRDPARLIVRGDADPADTYAVGKPGDHRATNPGPDLTIADREFDVESASGQNYHVTIPVANVGEDPASATSVVLLDVSGDEPNRIASFDVPALDVNESHVIDYDWDVSNVSNGEYALRAIVDPDDEVRESNETNNESPTVEIKVVTPPTGDTYLSDHDWVDATIGWGEIGLDESVDDNPIRIGGNEYEKGIGTHAESTITYNLGGNMSRFVTDVGVNDETGDDGSVRFHVVGDGETLAETDVLYGGDGPASLDVDVSGVEILDLVVTDGNGSINSDHADWAIAKVLE